MKRFLPILFSMLLSASISAQHIGVNLRVGLEKNFKINKKFDAELGQQFQVNPEINDAEDRYGNLFNEIYLFPFNAEDDTEEDDSSDESNDPDNALDDSPKQIDMEWRSATSLRTSYQLFSWLKLGQNYTFNLRKEDIRHGLSSFLEIEKYVVPKKLMLEWRFAYQQTSRKRKSGTQWQSDLVNRLNCEWIFKKNHRLYASSSINAELEEGTISWDRLRLDGGVRYRFRNIHQFDLGYRFQRQITGRKAHSHGLSLGYSIRL